MNELNQTALRVLFEADVAAQTLLLEVLLDWNDEHDRYGSPRTHALFRGWQMARNVTRWINVEDQLPELFQEPCDVPKSKPVLGVCYGDTIMVVVLEQWDEDSPPKWYSNCSEHWDMDGKVSRWMDLPPI